MSLLPRVAVGAVQADVDSQPVTWALMDLLGESDVQVQHFFSRSCFSPLDGASATTGVGSRYLDTWLMSKAVCRELLLHGSKGSELALVEGCYTPPKISSSQPGGCFETLIRWLDLPQLVVVDVSRLDMCSPPALPTGANGLLLDRVPNEESYFRYETELEALWGVPVLGSLSESASLRRALDRLPAGSVPPESICRHLGRSFARHAKLSRIRDMVTRNAFFEAKRELFRPELFQPELARHPLRVAVAFDDAFHCYFPETLDLLEASGATVIDFSPLRDESLPEKTDLVYLGCGHPERMAEELCGNQCMLQALRNHVCASGRIYAEGGGLAYLCQEMETSSGEYQSMTGVLPCCIRMNPDPIGQRPVEVMLKRDNWLGREGERLRGYLNDAWLLEPTGNLECHGSANGESLDLIGRFNVLASRVHLNFAAQPAFLRRFFQPCHTPPSRDRSKPMVSR